MNKDINYEGNLINNLVDSIAKEEDRIILKILDIEADNTKAKALMSIKDENSFIRKCAIKKLME